jgi:hypothetical protein
MNGGRREGPGARWWGAFEGETDGGSHIRPSKNQIYGPLQNRETVEDRGMGGVTAVDNGPGVENSWNRCDMEETKTTTIEGDKSNRGKHEDEEEEQRGKGGGKDKNPFLLPWKTTGGGGKTSQ